MKEGYSYLQVDFMIMTTGGLVNHKLQASLEITCSLDHFLISIYGCLKYKTNVEEGERGGTNDDFYV